jgi:hypothetical protein
MTTPPPLPPSSSPLRDDAPQQPLRVLPLETLRTARKPYQVTALVSWLIPILSVGMWILVPRPRGSRLDHTITGIEHFAFLVGLLVGIIALIGIIRRGGNVAPAIVGVALNTFLMFALPA